MSSTFDLSARITGDASGLASAGKQSVEALDNIGEASKRAGGGARELEQATDSAGRAQADNAKKTAEAARSTAEGAQAQRDAAQAARDAGTAQEGLGAAAARSGAQQAAAANGGVAAKQKLAAATTALDLAETRAASAVAGLELAHRKAALAADDDADAQLRVVRDLANAEARVIASSQAVAKAQAGVNEAQRDGARASGENAAAANRQGYAIRNVGQQFGDFGLQVAGGTSVARAFGQQAGQLGFALSEMEGKLGSVGKFLVGPWGIALTIAAAFVGPLIEKLFQANTEAADAVDKLAKAAEAADSYGAAQSLLAKVIDLTTGKLKTQNQVLIETIKLQAQANILKAQQDQADATKALRGAGQASLTESLTADFKDIGSSFGSGFRTTGTGAAQKEQAAALAPLNKAFSDYVRLTEIAGDNQDALSKGLDATNRVIDRLAVGGKIAGRSVIDLKQQLLALPTALNAQRANKQVVDAIDGKGIADDLRPTFTGSGGGRKPTAPKSTEARDEFGRDAASKIANLVGEFDEAPKVIDKTNSKIRELDDLIDDLGRKKPPGFGELIAQAEAAKVVVRDGLIREVAKAFEQPKTIAEKAALAIGQLDAVIADLGKNKPPSFGDLIASAETAKAAIADSLQKPYRDYINEQRDGLAVQRLVTEGRVDEANALKTVQGLQRTMGPLTEEQKDAVLATVEAMRLEQRQLEIRNELQAKYLTAVGSIKGVVQDATQAFVRGDLGQLIKAPQKLLDSFLTLKGDKIFDNLFGGAFRDLKDQVNGVSPVKDAATRMGKAVDEVAEKSKVAATAFGTIKPPIDAATDALGNFTAALNKAAGAGSGVPANDNNPSSSSLPGGVTVDADGTINITPNPLPQESKNPKVPGDSADPFNSAIAKIGTQVAGIFTNPTNASKIGTSIGKFAGKGLEGAATGTFVNGILSPIGKALGVKTSQTGAQIGGAIGSFVPIPGGQIIGSVLGSLVGGLFKSNNKFGSSTLDLSSGRAEAGTSIGKGKAERQQADALGGSLADGLNSIVSALGAQLGTANVSIGYRPGHKAGAFRVDTSGGGKVTGVEAFDTEAEAVAFAIRDAILDGGITGLSAAMQKALTSNADIDRAVQETLGVKALEASLGGIAGSLKAQFAAEDAAGRERVRLAKAYGVDLAAVEKLNAEQRVALVDATLKSRIGSLTSLSSSLQFGDLAEGSPADKLKALQVEIDKVQKQAEAGVDGAADTLASLLTKKITDTREAFGTAGGEYSGARADSASAVDRVIKMETDRVNAAAATTATQTATLQKIASLGDEGNNMMAVAVEKLTQIANNMGGGTPLAANSNYASARTVALA